MSYKNVALKSFLSGNFNYQHIKVYDSSVGAQLRIHDSMCEKGAHLNDVRVNFRWIP